ncbi:MAG: DDE-type integrase/transposase/recombinase [Rudaea sp.]|uniref:DDE-type integrase/transposase/recombinase n=1 Tax=unclassified Rudaea TaxID=2627037 RepID=UPI0010F8A4CC|nr:MULTISPECIES: DDE-type integrase/transposase/recombinase [unclassified Rudaea]MBN8886828.1 DDE-type integrase/transposase/recombinase [Rudaea sp.]
MSFSTKDLDDYLKKHDLSERARDYIRAASQGPSRDVGTTTYRSVVCEYPSRKMGTSIATESRTGEFAYASLLEYDPDVLAYYEQPPMVDCVRTDRKGRRGVRAYYPDFLVLRCTTPTVAQVKPYDALVEKTESYPTDWCREGDRFRDLAAESAFAKLGLVHEVVGSHDLPKIRVANLQLLLQAKAKADLHDVALRSEILRVLDRNAVLRVSELAQQLKMTDLTPIILMVDDGQIHTLLDTMLLSQPDSCWVSRSPRVLAAVAPTKGNIGSANVEHVPPFLQVRRGVDILSRLEANEKGRSIRRYRKAIEEATASGKSALAAVTPKTYLSGNRNGKRPPDILEEAERFIREQWGDVCRRTRASCLRLYKTHAAKQHPGQAPVSRPTLKAIISRHTHEGAQSRGGIRAGNAVESPTNVEDRVLPATRPFERASCDHYLCDVYCAVLVEEKKVYTAKPWLTILRDCATGVLLGYWLSFRSPSRTACAMVLRSCLRRHGRLPEGIVVDRGSEFRSVYFAALLAHCAVALILRPSSHPRYGSEAERLFGDFKTQWLNLRPGNTAVHQESRSVSSSHKASAHAEMWLSDLYQEIGQFSDWREDIIPNSGPCAPRVLFKEGLGRFPFSGHEIPFDDTFRIASAIEEAKVSFDPARGLLIGDPKKWYWSPVLARSSARKKLEVRRDPEDQTTVYARIGDQWHPCFSSGHDLAQAKDPIIAFCDSIVSLTCSEARKEAKDKADIALVGEVRKADERLKAKEAMISVPDKKDEVAIDPFASLRDLDVESPNATSWEVL